jgi:1-pyrroline-5-carboxylate dehydrogenase
MHNAIYQVPLPQNEPVLNYAPGSAETTNVKKAIEELRSKTIEVPMYIGANEVFTDKKIKLSPPHNHQHVLGYASEGDATHVKAAIDAALEARNNWANLPWNERAAV